MAKNRSSSPASASAKAGASSSPEQVVLAGSSSLPAVLTIGGVDILLGAIVTSAHEASGLSAAEWNALSADDRDALLQEQIDSMESDAAEAAGDGGDAPPAAVDAPAFPRQIRIGNHSHVALVDPVSGLYLGPGGTGETTLHDADHAHRVVSNFKALIAANYLPPEAVRIDGLPE